MGRRSRKRADGPVVTRPATAAPPPAAPRRAGSARPTIDDRPKPPWHPVPLIELCVLAGIVLIIVGFLNTDTHKGRVALIFGVVLASLAGLDTAAREHYAGFKSHSVLLGSLPAVLVAGALFFAQAPWVAIPLAAVLAFALALTYFRRAFRRRAGVTFRA